ncbi:FadR family transcriptional regulator [Desulfovibrio subterraneus]|uniref:FadR/GntR family transcriptional regulator n=1 Tax=Desulfovibrio subterraneus TaxID=2718620 RepID=UPI0022B86A24|nr:FadR/GntR family transcriptional regulator [Desulfovibrio subterraneus]WBF66460.1 FadR family transcriptional regulator [Desulfovibrio subterraneus]
MPCEERGSICKSEFVFVQLRDNIFRGELKPGEPLPSARRLAELMQVSKYAVDKAMNTLADLGYIERRKGQRCVVALPHTQVPSSPFSFIMNPRSATLDELMEVRIGLESHGVTLAVERADERDIAFLKHSLAELMDGDRDSERSRDSDIRFHMGIALATHNSVYIDLIRHFYSYMFDSISDLHDQLYENRSNHQIIEQHHYKILDAIVSRDANGARRYMAQHIMFLRSFLRDRNTERNAAVSKPDPQRSESQQLTKGPNQRA